MLPKSGNFLWKRCKIKILTLQTYYIVSGSQDFGNDEAHVCIILVDDLDIQIKEDYIQTPLTNPNNRKNEIQNCLRVKFHDPSISFIQQAFGLMGIIRFTAGYYIVLIEKIEIIGKISNHEIYSVKRSSLLKLFDNKYMNNLEKSINKTMTSYLKLEKCDFFFSYTYDLTHNLQDNFVYSFQNKQNYKEFYESDEIPNFQWNFECFKNFRKKCSETNPNKWVVRLIHGSYEQINLELFSNIINVSLIARRLIQNAGTRYNRRGLNSEVSFVLSNLRDFRLIL